MGTNSVIIRRCASLPEAYACLGLLKANGFLASLDNANHATVDWAMVQALGGIQIRVPISQFDDAKTCIVESVTASTQDNPVSIEMTRWNRIKAISMALIYFGIVELIGVIALLWLNHVIPPEWIPEPSSQISVVTTGSGLGIARAEQWLNGAVFLFFIVLYLLFDVTANKPHTHDREPQV